MKNKAIEKLLSETNKEIDYTKKTVSLSYNDNKGYYITSSIDVENDIYDIESNINLREVQEDIIINYLCEFWHQHFSDNFTGSALTMDDKLHANELLYK